MYIEIYTYILMFVSVYIFKRHILSVASPRDTSRQVP